MRQGSFTFATFKRSAKLHEKAGATIEEMDDNRWAVTYPLESIPATVAGVEALIANKEADYETLTIKDAEGNTLWTEEDFE
jgi:hypothetical protein